MDGGLPVDADELGGSITGSFGIGFVEIDKAAVGIEFGPAGDGILQRLAQLVDLMVGAAQLGDVASVLEEAHERPVAVVERRNGEADRNAPAIFACEGAFVGVLAAQQSFGKERVCMQMAADAEFLNTVTNVLRRVPEIGCGLADHFFGGVAEKAFRGRIPAGDHTILVY